MKTYLGLFAGLALLLNPGLVRAQFSITAQVGGVPNVGHVTLENFDDSTPALLTLANAYLVTGSVPYDYVAPYLSGSTAAFFGESPVMGPDASQYVAVEGNGSATFNFSAPQKYFGLLWGSLDQFNELDFYDSQNALIGTVTGSEAVNPSQADGDPGLFGTWYVNITSSVPFSKVVASTPVSAFEFDDVAYAATVQPVPEPATGGLIACGLGLAFLALNRKRG